jgi:acyl-CoA thioesterase-2
VVPSAIRADEWLLYAQDSPNAANARGFNRGMIFDASGRLVASTAQEGLIRQREPSASRSESLRT